MFVSVAKPVHGLPMPVDGAYVSTRTTLGLPLALCTENTSSSPGAPFGPKIFAANVVSVMPPTSVGPCAFAALKSSGYLARADQEAVELTRSGLLRVDVLLPRFFLPEHAGIRYT